MNRVSALMVLLLAGCSSAAVGGAPLVGAPAPIAQTLRYEPLRTAEHRLAAPLAWPERNQGVAPQPRTAP